MKARLTLAAGLVVLGAVALRAEKPAPDFRADFEQTFRKGRTWAVVVQAGVPTTSIYGVKGEWEVENQGIKPDIEVENDPASVAAGHDRQLEKAVEVTLEALKKNNVVNPVVVARDGREALDYLHACLEASNLEQSPLPGLILLDLNMPYAVRVCNRLNA